MKKLILPLFLLFALTNISCSVYQTIVNLSRLKFKLGRIDNLMVSGISLEGKTKLSDFNPLDILKLSSSVASNKFPVSFTLNVEAKNPNDGTGGYARTNATIVSFPWKLLIDDKETITGNLANPVSVPGTGEITTIPIQMNVDLIKFFGDKGYESLINLAMSIAGEKGYSSRIALYAQPTVSSPLGNITYPGELKIVSKQFTN